MDPSNTALRTIPKFDFGDFLPILFRNAKKYITFSNSPDPDQRAPTRALWSESELFEKNNLDSLQSASGFRVESVQLYSLAQMVERSTLNREVVRSSLGPGTQIFPMLYSNVIPV